jgi:DNA gyrase inhibitor GyrI
MMTDSAAFAAGQQHERERIHRWIDVRTDQLNSWLAIRHDDPDLTPREQRYTQRAARQCLAELQRIRNLLQEGA